jgi:hypothetical protein
VANKILHLKWIVIEVEEHVKAGRCELPLAMSNHDARFVNSESLSDTCDSVKAPPVGQYIFRGVLDNPGSLASMAEDVHTTDGEWKIVEGRKCRRGRLKDLRGGVNVSQRQVRRQIKM